MTSARSASQRVTPRKSYPRSAVRLSGLYLLRLGAHNAWLSMEEAKQCAEGLINQVHYDDAAGCAV